MDQVLSSTIAVVIVDRNNRSVDGKLFKVGTTVAVKLGIEVGENAALQQRVIGEVDASHNVTRLELGIVSISSVCGTKIWFALLSQLTMICSVSAK